MIRIRRQNGVWEIRRRYYEGEQRSWRWSAAKDLHYVQQNILEFASRMDHYIKEATELIDNKSEIYFLEDGELRRHNPVKSWSGGCLTLAIQHSERLCKAVQLITSGKWVVRTWVTPEKFVNEWDNLFIIEKVKSHYLIAITRDDTVVPFEVL